MRVRPPDSGRLFLLVVNFLEFGVNDLVITGPLWARSSIARRLLRGRGFGLVHRLADLHRPLAEPVGRLLQGFRIGALQSGSRRRDSSLSLTLLLGSHFVAVLLQV